ncbi:MAG: phasin family protein [Magnetospirillum sp.]|nr:phasin family protein [Magnetospirillum sp.]
MASKRDDRESADRPAEATASEPAGAGEQPARTRRSAEGGGDGGGATRMAERNLAQATDIGRRSQEQMRSLMGASTRAYRDMSEFSRGDVDALMQTSARLAKGMQDMSWEMMQYTQDSLRMSMKAANSMMTCRSVEDFVQVQRDFLRDSVDTFLQEGARLLELSGSVANEAVSPLNERSQTGPRH